MALIAIKDGTKTKYVTEEIYKKLMQQQKKDGFNPSAGDITCSNAKSVALGFSEEDYNRIFKK